ncbi:hypothetical protein L249_1486 [Ophiocordyceps polyrhachis-furcata BCC 54312]|uniref:Uncharacterized protein n=1 Tax=Ophiocordyceps polyrhachis-furcata BCC 54312 TaxID=1330021 RepID=A0A367L436_9HYPO|nr:hypothetical protein L249_1486 [Ophiocordyceps polyrhachis-furcata BCC 54312]
MVCLSSAAVILSLAAAATAQVVAPTAIQANNAANTLPSGLPTQTPITNVNKERIEELEDLQGAREENAREADEAGNPGLANALRAQQTGALEQQKQSLLRAENAKDGNNVGQSSNGQVSPGQVNNPGQVGNGQISNGQNNNVGQNGNSNRLNDGGQSNTGQLGNGQISPGQVSPGQISPGQISPGQINRK